MSVNILGALNRHKAEVHLLEPQAGDKRRSSLVASSAGSTGGVFCALMLCRKFVGALRVWGGMFGWAGHDISARHSGGL